MLSKIGQKKMGPKQTLDISLAPYDRCKKSIKKNGARIRPLYVSFPKLQIKIIKII